MSDLRDLLEREARRVHAEPGALDGILHRARRRHRTHRITAGVVALAIAIAGGVGAYRAFRPSAEQTPAIGGAAEPFPGIWPETTWAEHAAAQKVVGEEHQPWRLDPVETAEAFAGEMLRWDAIEGAVLGSDDPDAIYVEVHGTVPGHNETLTEFVTVQQPGGKGSGSIWSVTDASTQLLQIASPVRGEIVTAGGSFDVLGWMPEPPPGAKVDIYTSWPGRPSGQPSLQVDADRIEHEIGLPTDLSGDPILSIRLLLDGRILGLHSYRLRNSADSPSVEIHVFFGEKGRDPTKLHPVTRLVPEWDPLEGALRALLRGPTKEESASGIVSPFSSATAGALNHASVGEDSDEGVALVDLRDLSDIIPPLGRPRRAALEQLNATVFQFPEIHAVAYSFDGDCGALPRFFLGVGCAAHANPNAPGMQEADPDLPEPVANTRDAIVAAAGAHDWDALRQLINPDNFTYSFGDSGDPVAYWRELEAQGEDPLGTLQQILEMPSGLQEDQYIWPSFFRRDPADWTDDDLRLMRTLGSEEDIQAWREFGGYIGYRMGIAPDGTWLFFVAGD